MGGKAKAKFNLFQAFLVGKNNRGKDFGLGGMKAVALRLHVLKVPGYQLDKLVMVEIPSRRNDNVAGRKAVRVSIDDGLALEALYRLLGAQDRLAQRMILPEILGEDFVNEVIRIVLVHLDLFHDHAAFAGDIGAVEHGIQHQIAENIERGRNVLVEHLDVEADALLSGEGIHIAADGVDLAGYLLGGAVLGPFKDHVLNKVGDAVPLRFFIARTGLQPNPYRGRADVRH